MSDDPKPLSFSLLLKTYNNCILSCWYKTTYSSLKSNSVHSPPTP